LYFLQENKLLRSCFCWGLWKNKWSY